MKKKGQIQTLETMAVLFVFFFLIAISMIFLSTYQKGRAEVAVHDLYMKQAERIAKSVLDTPEFRTTKKGIKGTNTFDLMKMVAFRDVLDQNPELEFAIYKEKFGNSRIIVHSLYPVKQDYEIYGTLIEDHKGDRYPYFIPVSLYDPLDSSLSFALLEVQYYAG